MPLKISGNFETMKISLSILLLVNLTGLLNFPYTFSSLESYGLSFTLLFFHWSPKEDALSDTLLFSTASARVESCRNLFLVFLFEIGSVVSFSLLSELFSSSSSLYEVSELFSVDEDSGVLFVLLFHFVFLLSLPPSIVIGQSDHISYY